MTPHAAMLLAAGLGTRMRPLTDHLPKPLLALQDRPLLDHALDRLAEAGVRRVVVNAHWQADRLEAHLAARRAPPATVLLREAELLDTGGAVRAALPLLGDDPFYVVNGDAFWRDGPAPALRRLAAAWTETLDAVLLMHRTFQVLAETGPGDFAVDPLGHMRRRRTGEIVPYLYAGLQLIHPRLLADTHGRFSMNTCWDRAIAVGRARAVVHDGLWYHLSTPADLAAAEAQLQARALGETR